MKVNRFEDAYKCLERSSPLLRHSPRLWYNMGLCSLIYIRDFKHSESSKVNDSNLFRNLFGPQDIKYQRNPSSQRFKRVQMPEKEQNDSKQSQATASKNPKDKQSKKMQDEP